MKGKQIKKTVTCEWI